MGWNYFLGCLVWDEDGWVGPKREYSINIRVPMAPTKQRDQVDSLEQRLHVASPPPASTQASLTLAELGPAPNGPASLRPRPSIPR